MIDNHNYNCKCWWCGNVADSREHRFKRSDLIREFGEDFDRKEVIKTNGNFDIENGIPIQGPNSDHLKFSKNICQKCNNERSQRFDKAYDLFMNYLKNNEETIFETSSVNLIEIYNQNWKIEYEHLIKYFTKNICTRLADSKVKIDDKIINFLNGSDKLYFFKLVFQIRTDWVEFYKHLKSINQDYGYVYASGIRGDKSKSLGNFYWLGGTLQYRWFQVTYYYDKIRLDYPLEEHQGEIIHLIDDYTITPEKMKANIANTTV